MVLHLTPKLLGDVDADAADAGLLLLLLLRLLWLLLLLLLLCPRGLGEGGHERLEGLAEAA
jgi:hypothetical protein